MHNLSWTQLLSMTDTGIASRGPTLELSGGRKAAKPPWARPLERPVRAERSLKTGRRTGAEETILEGRL